MRPWCSAAFVVLALAGCGPDAASAPTRPPDPRPSTATASPADPATTVVAASPVSSASGRTASTYPPAPTRLGPFPTTTAGPSPVAPEGPARPVTSIGRVLYLGDSVLAAAADDAGARARLLAGIDGVVDAEVCRRLVEVSCTSNGRTPDTVVDAIRRHARSGATMAVVEAGYNDTSLAGAIDTVMAELYGIGIRRVLWVTYHEGDRRFRGHNLELDAAVRRFAGALSLIDWNEVAAGHADWFLGDQIHLTAAGATALADVIAVGVRAAR